MEPMVKDRDNEKELWQKAEELTGKLTLDEKIGMIHGARLFQTQGVSRLGIPPLKMSDGPMGVRQEFLPDQWKAVGNTDDYVTYLPCCSALAATWNRTVCYEAGKVLGAEARGRGKDVILAPGVNLKRSPLCGRNFEYFSEDPYLTGELAAAFVQGVQSFDVAACVKHFAVNNQETERLWMEVKIDEAVLRELYLPAFYAALKKGGAYTVMGAYNKLYGEHCCQSEFLLKQILRTEWEYDGVVISDWGAVHDTQAAADSQLDIEMSVTSDFDAYFMAAPLKKAIGEGRVKEEAVNEKVTRILALMMRLHMMDGTRKRGCYNTEGHRQTALQAARESVVLLKNEKGRLPLSREEGKKVLVIGENGNRTHSDGGGSGEIKALYEITPLMGIKKLLGGNAQVDYIPGYTSGQKEKEAGQVNWQQASLEQGGGHTQRQEDKEAFAKERTRLLRQALELAPLYDQVIFVGGLNHDQDCEGSDRADMKLPYEQDRLLLELLSLRPDTVVVLLGGSPVEMGRWIDRADSLVWAWYGGMEGGTALAEVLYGLVNPSGKLPESFYKTHMDCSAHCLGEFGKKGQVEYREGRLAGYRYLEAWGVEPEFCFGHGLSYTTFSLEGGAACKRGEKVCVSCIVRNTGNRGGAETVQAYVSSQAGERGGIPVVFWELKGFEKVFLEPGETKNIVIELEGGLPEGRIALGTSLKEIRMEFSL